MPSIQRSRRAWEFRLAANKRHAFAYRQPVWAKQLEIFEPDHPATAADKQLRLSRAGLEAARNVHYLTADFPQTDLKTVLETYPVFGRQKISLCSLPDLSYYLPKQILKQLMSAIAQLTPIGKGRQA